MVNSPAGAKRVRPSGLLVLSSVIVFVSMGAAPGAAPRASAATAATASDCARWTPVVTPTANRLQAVDEISPNDVWAVGEDTEHWDGTGWTVVSSPNIGLLYGVAGTSSSDVWVASGSGQVERWDGSKWTLQNPPLPASIVGASSPTNVFLLARGGQTGWALERWNGSKWTVFQSTYDPGYYSFYAISVQSPTDVWLGGGLFNDSHADYPKIEHWNGTTFSEGAGSFGPNYGDVTGFDGSANDLWAAGYVEGDDDDYVNNRVLHWDGSAWADMHPPDGSGQAGVNEMSPSEVVSAGGNEPNGHLLWDGSTWHSLGAGLQYVFGMSGDADVAWAVGDPVSLTSDIETYPCPDIDLSVSGKGPKKIVEGQVAAFTYTVSVPGPYMATGVQLTDALPSGLQFASVTSSQGQCTFNGTVTCDLGWLAGDATVTVRATVAKAGKITNTAVVSADQPDPQQGNNAAPVTILAQPAAPGTPSYHFVQPSRVTNGTPTLVPEETQWAASPTGNICRYDARMSTNGGPYKALTLDDPTALDVQVNLAVDSSYRFEVRARDCGGVYSSWSVGPKFTVDGFQESAATYSGTRHTWRHAALTGAWGGFVDYTTTADGSATFQFQGRNVAWVGTVGPTYGMADVYLDGVLTKTIDCYAAAQSTRQVLFRFGWLTSAPHTIKIVDKGTTGRPRIDVDGFATFR
jgi:uncharacterized repeat protein (TIGR01451 family)